ncbi:MAG: DNA polymerase III subunit alpha [Bacteroidota bacterium]
MILNAHSYYSFHYGTMSPEALLQEAQLKGFKKLALTDINATSGCMNFVRLSSKYDIEPVLGLDFRNGAQPLFVGIAKNNQGFYELNQYISDPFLEDSKPIPSHAPFFENAFIIYPLSVYDGKVLNHNEFVGVRPQELSKIRFSDWQKQQHKLVVLQTGSFRHKRDFNAHRLLRAIGNNTLLSKLPKTEEGLPTDVMPSMEEFLHIYKEYPQIIFNTENLLAQCSIDFDFGEDIPHKNQKHYTGSEQEDYDMIRSKCAEGLLYRYGTDPNDEIMTRLESELKIIRQKGFLAYFLINWDIINHAREQDVPYVGRGSGANSIVAYLLRITDVDPIELDLYFERFINLYRKNPPDFDIDFASRDRNYMTQYIFEQFPHTSLLATYSTFQYRAVVRELGKVFGLPPHEIDKLSEGKRGTDELSNLVLKYGNLIQGLPHHLSIHAGGILISDKSIHHYTATNKPPKGFRTVQFDMIVAEDIGLYKFDILGQRGLSKIQDALKIVKYNHPEDPEIDIHDVKQFYKDEKVKGLLREGKAIGCFYVESPAMRMLLKKLKADHYLGLVAASSIIRPGVAKSGMMREYILRFRKPERIKDAHPTLLDIMPETFGVMVYQEDVIKVAHHFADLTLAEADVLRRGMSGKYRSREEFQKARDKFFENCDKKGYKREISADVWRQIESFAGYAFSKGHSASYAVESYQSLYLKAYYPLEYMVATINNGGGFYRQELYVHEARMHGAKIEAPCINRSLDICIIHGNTIFLGLGLISEVEHGTIEAILLDRYANGIFMGISDFINRVAISLEQLLLLIRIGCFRFTDKTKKELLWNAHLLLGSTKKSNPEKMLFETPARSYELPPLYSAELEDAFEEIELLGFPLSDPFNLLKNKVEKPLTVREFPELLKKEVTIPGYLITIKNTSTTSGKRMHFGTFLDVEGHFIDTVHFPPVAAKYPFRGKGIYTLTGVVVEEFDFYTLEVTAMTKEDYINDPRYFDENTDATEISASNGFFDRGEKIKVTV